MVGPESLHTNCPVEKSKGEARVAPGPKSGPELLAVTVGSALFELDGHFDPVPEIFSWLLNRQ